MVFARQSLKEKSGPHHKAINVNLHPYVLRYIFLNHWHKEQHLVNYQALCRR